MEKAQIALLLFSIPVLCATDMSTAGPGPVSEDPYLDLKVYIHEITDRIAIQIDHLAHLIDEADVEALRREHYEWRLSRDLECYEVGRGASHRLVELECLSEKSEDYFVELEARVAASQDGDAAN